MSGFGDADVERINRDLRDAQRSSHYYDKLKVKAEKGDVVAAARLDRYEKRMARRNARTLEDSMSDFRGKIQQRAEPPTPPSPPKIEIDQTEIANEAMFMFDGVEAPTTEHQTDTAFINAELTTYLVLEDDASEIYVAKCDVNAEVTDVI